MADEDFKQRLTAIISADVKDYSRLLSQDRVNTIKTINEHREMFAIFVKQYGGHVVDMPGDNILAILESVSDAVNCAVEIQRELAERNAEVPSARMMQWRIGIELGDVVEQDEGIYGDGVNIAARIEGFATAGGICISGTVYDQVHGKLGLQYEFLGKQDVKNIAKPVSVYRVLSYPGAAAHRVVKAKDDVTRKWRKAAIASVAVIIVAVGAVLAWLYLFRTGTPPTEVAKPETAVAPVERAESSIPKRLSIAVLPFDNMSGDPNQEYFSDGITEEIITTLSRSKHLLVIARNSTFTYKGRPVKVQQVGRELGATHIVEGSVRKEGNKIRITAQLVSATTGNHIWAETYDRELKDILVLQNEISEEIAGALIVGYEKSEMERVRRIPTDNLTALDFYWRGVLHFYKLNKESNAKARDYFKRAIELDPKFSTAYAVLGFTEWNDYAFGFTSAREKSLERAFDMAQKSIALNETNVVGYILLSNVYSVKNQYEQAIAAAKKSISIDPNRPYAYAEMAHVLNSIGRPEEAIEAMEKAIRLNPHHPALYETGLGMAFSMVGRYKEAIKSLKKALILNPNLVSTYWVLSSTYITMWLTQQSQDPQVLDRALKRAEQALNLGDSPVGSHLYLSLSYLYKKQYEQAIAHGEKALTIAPNNSDAKNIMGALLMYIGKPEETIELLEKADLNIRHESAGLLLLIKGMAYRLTGRYEEAIETQKQVLVTTPVYYLSFVSHVELSILYSDLNLKEDAQIEAVEVLKLVPNFSVEVWGQRIPFKYQTQIERDMAALRKAGLK